MQRGKTHMEKCSMLLLVRTKCGKTDPSKLTYLKRLKGASESENMVHFTNREDKNKRNDYCDRNKKPECKLKLMIPESSQKPTLKGTRM